MTESGSYPCIYYYLALKPRILSGWLLVSRLFFFTVASDSHVIMKEDELSFLCICVCVNVGWTWLKGRSLQASLYVICASMKKTRRRKKSHISLTHCPHISALVHLHRSVQVVGFISGRLVSVG